MSAILKSDVITLRDRIIAEGEEVRASGSHPFLLSEPEFAYYVESGRVELFTVDVRDGQPAGARSHFVTVVEGQCMWGMDITSYGGGAAFLAAGRLGTMLRRIPVKRLSELSIEHPVETAELVDAWVSELSTKLTADMMPGPLPEATLAPGQTVVLKRGQYARNVKGLVWFRVNAGDLLYISLEELLLAGSGAPFPLAPEAWIDVPSTEEQAEIQTFSTEATVVDGGVWWGLQLFHEALCQCQFINKKLATIDEFVRLRSKADYAVEAEEEAQQDLASVLGKKSKRLKKGGNVAVQDEDEIVFQACRLVGEAMGIDVKRHPEPREHATAEDRVAETAKASRFRTRIIALRDDWWKRDQGPIWARWEANKQPVALIPTGPSSYMLHDPANGTQQKLTASVAGQLSPFAFVFYTPLPDGELGVWDLVKFGARGVSRDLVMILLIGALMGMLGNLVPYATGQIFDSAIPQANRNLLVQFGVALLVAAVTSAAFKITQSIAVIRLQGRMDYSIQAALWDRLLGLPATFFREYSSGDLADRAAGIGKIRDLLAGTGVAAILGVITSVFYVIMLLSYSVKMAMLAFILTLGFVGVTMGFNYAQLRFQRERMKANGKIAGLILQLISGVAKVRTSGAESHAFRVWAKQFADQRRITFSMRRIQNWGTVFNRAYPILATGSIFFALVSIQTASEGKSMTTGQFIGFTAAFGMFLASIQALGDASMSLLGMVPTYERFKPIITTLPETDLSKAYPGKLTGSIELSHVSFRYQEDSPWILNDISLKIEPGEFIAFVGGSGSGKSTMMRLMLGFETPQKGTLYYNGQDLQTLDIREVRQQLGVVLQTSRVLPTDIFRNIVGATNSLTIDDAWRAAESAGLADDIREMPMGMHTYVAEGGGGFSGGQKQRLLIARAVVNRPRILFLDEATSALDNRTQAIVTESMNKLQATRIVIAHRLSTIVNADRICVLESGVLKEVGTYDELMAKNGIFAELARRQIA